LIIDYHEAECSPDGELSIYAGIQFEDEADSLYVIHISADSSGQVKEWKLLFNGFDCNYVFKEDEKKELQNRLSQDGIFIHEAK
jgi:hypothetical protein